MKFQKMPKNDGKSEISCERFFTKVFEILLVKAVWTLKLRETDILISNTLEMGHKARGEPQEP